MKTPHSEIDGYMRPPGAPDPVERDPVFGPLRKWLSLSGRDSKVQIHEGQWNVTLRQDGDMEGEGKGETLAEASADALNDIMRRAAGRRYSGPY